MTTRKNHVRFDDRKNETLTFCTADYTLDLWYGSEDYKYWKKTSRDEARVWRRRCHYGDLLEETFEKPCRDAQKRIMAFAQLSEGSYFRGMEIYLNRKHSEERMSMRHRAIQGVLVYQRRQKKRGECSPTELEEELSFLAREYSRPAKLFARRLGNADEIVALQGETNTDDAQLLLAELFLKAPLQLARWDSSGSVDDASKASAQLPRKPVRSQVAEPTTCSIHNSSNASLQLPRKPVRYQVPAEPTNRSIIELREPPMEDSSVGSCRSQQPERGATSAKCPGSPASPFDEIVEATQHLLILKKPSHHGSLAHQATLYTLHE